ncbi:MAG: 30S ribosomal protein S27e [Candidatus Aenigmatarchaeota archaeon]
MSNGTFLKVKCRGCKNEQIIFSKASTTVNCLVCGAELASPSGGKAVIKTKILEWYN